MRSAILLVPEVGPGSGPDMTRYLVVCVVAITALLAVLWLFRRYLARHLKARASRRSLQVLDVLPLSGKQKLVVVRCYDRSFLLGLGEKEVRAIAELELELDGAAPARPPSAVPSFSSFSDTLENELVLEPTPPRSPSPVRDLKGGILA